MNSQQFILLPILVTIFTTLKLSKCLSEIGMVAHYPLNGTLKEITGAHPDITILPTSWSSVDTAPNKDRDID